MKMRFVRQCAQKGTFMRRGGSRVWGMTFSIVARSGDGTQFGVAVASKFLAVGAAVPAASVGVGAIATQSFVNLTYRPVGLQLLADGASATDTLAALTVGDRLREQRQAGVVSGSGDGATFTGAECFPWAGGATGDGYAIQGNILTGPQVVADMEQAFLATGGGEPLANRLLAALTAGDRAGGDRRGRQSAALLVVSPGGGYGGGSDVLVDLRVDDHPDPVTELARLLDLHRLYFERPDPADCLPLDGALADEVRTRLVALGYERPELESALAAWAGVENLEERLVPGRIDPLVLEQLRAQP
jgi:uncharacterized Ntn-hydrolase superfamily protein